VCVCVCVCGAGVYIITEWIPNGDLTHLLKNLSVDISWKDRVQMLMDAAVAMRYLHAHNIIHRSELVRWLIGCTNVLTKWSDLRDLKSENLLLTENGRIKVCPSPAMFAVVCVGLGRLTAFFQVCDLGFARTTKRLTRTMSVAGTELYMAVRLAPLAQETK